MTRRWNVCAPVQAGQAGTQFGPTVQAGTLVQAGTQLSDSLSECSSSLSRSSSRGGGDVDIKRQPSVKVPYQLTSYQISLGLYRVAQKMSRALCNYNGAYSKVPHVFYGPPGICIRL